MPPYTIHQHGGDRDVGCQIYVPQSRMIHALGLLHREQIKFADKPDFPGGTEPLYDSEKKLIGYRIKKGILGITEDIDVYLGSVTGCRRACFAPAWRTKSGAGPLENTYDRYLSCLAKKSNSARSITHVIRYEEQPWEWTRQGRLKWYTHPHVDYSARGFGCTFKKSRRKPVWNHRHMAEEQIFIINGKGYDIHDGERWNWQKGDLINIPAMVEHQHFNAIGENPVLLMSSMPSMCTDLGWAALSKSKMRRNTARKEDNSHGRERTSPRRFARTEVDPKLYYDYEGRFIKQKLERERMELLPRVVKPPMFAKGGHILGDLRVFERYTVAPLSALTPALSISKRAIGAKKSG